MMTAEQVQPSKSLLPRLMAFVRNGNGNIMRLLATVAIIFVLLSIFQRNFLTIRNMQSMAFQASEIGVLALAIALAMLSGGIDLSVVSTANLSGIIAGLVLAAVAPPDPTGQQIALSIALAILAALGVGIIGGLINGILIAVFGMAPILATLGTLLAYKGIGTGITKGTTIFGTAQFQYIGNGLVGGVVPFPLIILLVVAAVLALILGKTRFGLRLYMLGTNPTAARFSGIDNRGVLIRSYILSGLLASIAGIIILGRTNAANVDFGGSYVLLAILIAVLGDVDPYGGSGSVFGVLLALVGLQFLSTGFNMLLFRSSGANFFKEFAWGFLLLLVLVINYFSRQRELRALKPVEAVQPVEAAPPPSR
ncbi:MAG: ABC transporter permease [Anaerolineae bacterium]